MQQYGAYGSFILLVRFPRFLNRTFQRRDLLAARGRTLGSVGGQLTESLVDIVKGAFRGFTLPASIGELLLTLLDCQPVCLQQAERALRLRQSAFVDGAGICSCGCQGFGPRAQALRILPFGSRLFLRALHLHLEGADFRPKCLDIWQVFCPGRFHSQQFVTLGRHFTATQFHFIQGVVPQRRRVLRLRAKQVRGKALPVIDAAFQLLPCGDTKSRQQFAQSRSSLFLFGAPLAGIAVRTRDTEGGKSRHDNG